MDNSLISAIDNHNVANGDASWFDKKIETTGEFLGDVGEALTKGAVGVVVAGVNSLANSAIAAANFLGTDIEQIDTYKALKGYDDDLGEYYKKHKEGIELGGFVAGSFIPGLAGVKAMQAAKAGFMGTNMAKSSGLMQTLTGEYAAAATAEFAAGNSPFTILNANVVKSLAQGFGANALEATAFETAATAFLYKSPVLEDQNAKDIFWNIATGTLLGGGIGGVFHGIKTVYGVKKGVTQVQEEMFNYRNISELDDLATPELKIMNYMNDKLSMPEAALSKDYKGNLLPDARMELITKAREETLKRLDVLLLEQFNAFAKGDAKIGQQLFEKFKDANSIQDVAATMVHTKGATRIGFGESLEVGDVLFPTHGITKENFSTLMQRGEHGKLFVDKATSTTQGYKVVGDITQLKIIGHGEQTLDGAAFYGNKDSAWAAGYDVYRNSNGTISVNPASQIIQPSATRRLGNNLIIDFENNSSIVSKATPGLADLATVTRPIEVRGSTVLVGELDPIKVDIKGFNFNPVTMNHLDVQARYIWAAEQKNINWKKLVISENDLPMLQRAYLDADAAKGFEIKLDNGKTVPAPTGEQLKNFINQKQHEFAEKLNGKPLDEIGIRLNATDKWLTGEGVDFIKIKPGVDYNTPRYARIDYADDVNAMEMYNAAKIDGAVAYEHQKIIIQQKHEQNFANYAKELASIFPERPNWNEPGRIPTSDGAGATLFGFANANYGSAGGWAQVVGAATNRLKVAMTTKSISALNNAISPVAALGKDAIAEAALVNNRLLQSPKAWVQHPTDSMKLIPREDFTRVSKGGKPSEELVISKKEVMDLLKTHAELNHERQVHIKNLKGTAGLGDDSDLEVFYPIPVDTTKLKHFVIVKPRGINLGDKSRVIAAKDEGTLARLAAEVDRNEFDVITKKETEQWHKAVGDYDFALGMNESMVDSSLKREGKLSQHFPTINEGFLDRMVEWHSRQSEMLATRMVEHKYSQSFLELQHLGQQYTNLATSQYRSLTEALVEKVKDPYQDIKKTALDISRASEYQWWGSFNETVKDAIEGPIHKLREIFAKTKDIDQAFVDNVNKTSAALGLGSPFKEAAQILMANQNIPNKPWLSKFIADANGIMATTLLQWDFFNAVNNVISNPILQSSEVKFLINGIMKGDKRIAGKLADLINVKMPDGSGISLPSVSRFTARAVENLAKDDGTLLRRYQEIGVDLTLVQQERQMRQALTLDFSKETAQGAQSAISKAAEFGRKWTGNTLAESTNRFLSADMMRQITDIAIEAGVLRNVQEANEYIQLAVSKMQGNYLHSQRPIVFQGVVGQAISLFQTYQFNLMQQMFKFVGEGDNKAIAMLMGLQGSIYGMQGLPAFNFINTHIVGNASGNTNHRDLYTASNTVFGKELGDWILYGAGSNALGLVDSKARFNLYSRGDINPRQLTVLPTQISDIPMVAASVRFVGNLWSAAEKAGNGAALWPTLSQAVEHNGLNRPLAGLAQIVQGYTTTNQGSLLTSAQDFWSISTVSRIAGAKPFDESVALDALYRINAYRAKDLSKIQELGSAIKTTVIAGGEPSEEQVLDFAKKYARSGGKIESFNKFFTNTMMTANRSQVNKIAENLNSPYSKQLQLIMGGHPLPDFLNQQ